MNKATKFAAALLLVCWASPTHAAPSWKEVPLSGLGITEHYNGFFAWDPTASKARFVGADLSTFSGLEADGTAWKKTAPDGPPKRSGFAAYFDTKRSAWVTYGGAYEDATWELLGTTWTQIKSPGPTGRWYAAMAYDPVRGRGLLFGGSALKGCDFIACGDTWEYDGAWHQMSPATAPPARKNAAMFFHPGLGRVVMVGGQGADCLTDSWSWSGTNWETLETTSTPEAGLSAGATWDAARGRAVLVVADIGCKYGQKKKTYELVGTSWVEMPVDTPWLYDTISLAFDPKKGEVFGDRLLEDHLYVYRNPLPLGASCGSEVGCESAHCKSGVCCTTACEGACSTCDVNEGALAAGTCGLLARGREVESCGPYRCDGAAPGCPASCTNDADCVANATCASGRCVPFTACTEDGLSVREGDQRSCAPFRCKNAACLSICETGADCAPGHVCATDGRCVATEAPTSDGGGCALGQTERPSLAIAALVAVLASLAVRKRRTTS